MEMPKRSVYAIAFGWFLRAGPPDQQTKTSWCFIGPALRLRRRAKTSPPPRYRRTLGCIALIELIHNYLDKFHMTLYFCNHDNKPL